MLRLLKYLVSLEECGLEVRTDPLEIELPGPPDAFEDAVDGLGLELRAPDFPGSPRDDLVDVHESRVDELSQRGITHAAVFRGTA